MTEHRTSASDCCGSTAATLQRDASVRVAGNRWVPSAQAAQMLLMMIVARATAGVPDIGSGWTQITRSSTCRAGSHGLMTL